MTQKLFYGGTKLHKQESATMNLFELGQFILHSGRESQLKIECDALTPADWECIASLVSKQFIFGDVIGVPTGGLAFARALKPYATPGVNIILIVDDVYTTGDSVTRVHRGLPKDHISYRGIVLFARGETPDWIIPVFSLHKLFRNM